MVLSHHGRIVCRSDRHGFEPPNAIQLGFDSFPQFTSDLRCAFQRTSSVSRRERESQSTLDHLVSASCDKNRPVVKTNSHVELSSLDTWIVSLSLYRKPSSSTILPHGESWVSTSVWCRFCCKSFCKNKFPLWFEESMRTRVLPVLAHWCNRFPRPVEFRHHGTHVLRFLECSPDRCFQRRRSDPPKIWQALLFRSTPPCQHSCFLSSPSLPLLLRKSGASGEDPLSRALVKHLVAHVQRLERWPLHPFLQRPQGVELFGYGHVQKVPVSRYSPFPNPLAASLVASLRLAQQSERSNSIQLGVGRWGLTVACFFRIRY